MLQDSSHNGLGTLVCTKKSLQVIFTELLECEIVFTILYIDVVLMPEQLSSVPLKVFTASVIGGLFTVLYLTG